MTFPTQPVIQAALVDLSLDAVALCGQGANTRADILLCKRKEKTVMPQTFEELMKGLEPDAAALVTKHIEGLQAADQATIGQLQGKITELEKSKQRTPPPAESQEDVFKGASPAMMAEIEKMRSALQTMQEQQLADIAEKRYQACKAIPVEEAKLKDVLKSASPAMLEVLKAAATAIEKNLMQPKGSEVDGFMKNSGSADAAYDELEKAAKAIMTAKSVTFESAFTEACAQNPDLYKKYVEGAE